MTEVVDTNIILRYLVGDIPNQEKQAVQWFKEAEKGKRRLLIKTIVVGEVTFVLESFYKFPRDRISETLESFLQHTWLDVEERKALLSLWKDYNEGLHFVDSYLLAWSKVHKGDILTFDKNLKKKKKTL